MKTNAKVYPVLLTSVLPPLSKPLQFKSHGSRTYRHESMLQEASMSLR